MWPMLDPVTGMPAVQVCCPPMPLGIVPSRTRGCWFPEARVVCLPIADKSDEPYSHKEGRGRPQV